MLIFQSLFNTEYFLTNNTTADGFWCTLLVIVSVGGSTAVFGGEKLARWVTLRECGGAVSAYWRRVSMSDGLRKTVFDENRCEMRCFAEGENAGERTSDDRR